MSWLGDLFRWRKKVNMERESYTNILAKFAIKPDKQTEINSLVEKFIATRQRYSAVAHMTGVPDDCIFAIHYRESSLNFKTCLHNGDKLPGPTTHVPKGRGPFNSWEEAAIDAIALEKGKFPLEWNIEGRLAFCEAFNGLGYKKRNLQSPYIFSWSNGYSKGKYVGDGVYNPDFVDQQCGCAPIIISILNNSK
jgi:lysozyme family protein